MGNDKANGLVGGGLGDLSGKLSKKAAALQLSAPSLWDHPASGDDLSKPGSEIIKVNILLLLVTAVLINGRAFKSVGISSLQSSRAGIHFPKRAASHLLDPRSRFRASGMTDRQGWLFNSS
jgi:hypothetical protein